MAILRNNDMKTVKMESQEIKNATKQTAISPAEGWDGWVMRIITLKKDGYTPHHTHPWAHINYIIGGNGTLFLDGKENSVTQGDTAFIPAGEEHQFKNKGENDFSFICIVPEEGDK